MRNKRKKQNVKCVLCNETVPVRDTHQFKYYTYIPTGRGHKPSVGRACKYHPKTKKQHVYYEYARIRKEIIDILNIELLVLRNRITNTTIDEFKKKSVTLCSNNKITKVIKRMGDNKSNLMTILGLSSKLVWLCLKKRKGIPFHLLTD